MLWLISLLISNGSGAEIDGNELHIHFKSGSVAADFVDVNA
jgi:hypothetical protein